MRDIERIFPDDVLTKHERVELLLDHQPLDRVPISINKSWINRS